jgi:hypothetical protein
VVDGISKYIDVHETREHIMDENFHLTSLQHVVRRTMHPMCKSMCLCTSLQCIAQSHDAATKANELSPYHMVLRLPIYWHFLGLLQLQRQNAQVPASETAAYLLRRLIMTVVLARSGPDAACRHAGLASEVARQQSCSGAKDRVANASSRLHDAVRE